MKRRMWGILLSLIMVVSLLPMTAFAESENQETNPENVIEETLGGTEENEAESIAEGTMEGTPVESAGESNEGIESTIENVAEVPTEEQSEVPSNENSEGITVGGAEISDTGAEESIPDEKSEPIPEESEERVSEGASEDVMENTPESIEENSVEGEMDGTPEEESKTEVPSADKSTNDEVILPETEAANGVSVDRGSSYDHIDVKVDGAYSINVDGTTYNIKGTLDAGSIKVVFKTSDGEKEYSGFSATRSEGSKTEYSLKVGREDNILGKISWGNVPYTMTNVYVSGRILLSNVPAILADILPKTEGGQYYEEIVSMQYAGVQECTGGRGMRSEGNDGTPTGLDLYITAQGAGVYLTKGKLAIQKVIVNEGGTAIADDTAFTFTIKGNGTDNTYSNTVTVKGGETLTLKDIPAGSYTITETQQTGYAIRSIDGEATTNYSKNYTVVAKNDDAIPVATFTNTKLTEQSSLNIKKTASGLAEGSTYPNPTISIYATDEAGYKLDDEPIWSGSLETNGDTLYLTPLLKEGTYLVEENGAQVEGHDCVTSLTVDENGTVLPNSGMIFNVSGSQKTYSITVNNQYSESKPPVPIQEETISVSVEKIWDDDEAADRPESVEVQLYCNDDAYGDAVILNEDNNWVYTWNELDQDAVWTVDEVNVPEGYEKDVSHDGNDWMITNTKTEDEPITTPTPEPTETPEPTVTPKPSVTPQPTTTPKITVTSQVPKTGDDNNVAVWGALVCVAVAGVLFVIWNKKGSGKQ
jgi:LPXTG-motif cell wall-anchored protein